VRSVSDPSRHAASVHADLTAEDIERLDYPLGALRASLMLCEDNDVGAFNSDLRAAFFANLASMATSSHAIVSHLYVRAGWGASASRMATPGGAVALIDAQRMD
jgi:hypothetical protein